MKLYDDDTEVLRLAQADGVRARLFTASRKATATAFAIWPRLYVAHVVRDDSGFSCIEVETFAEWLELIERLPAILGSVSSVRFEPSE